MKGMGVGRRQLKITWFHPIYLSFLLLSFPVFAFEKINLTYYFQQSRQLGSITEKIELASNMLLGAPYSLYNLGDGPDSTYDQNPIYDFNSFDCTTFVETVLSLANAQNLDQFSDSIQHVRYQGGLPSFTTRNHFPELDWFPNNSAEGFIKEITLDLYPQSPSVTKTIDKNGWYKKLPISRIRVPGISSIDKQMLLEQLRSEGDSFQAQTATLNYIPKEILNATESQLTQEIPSGSIIAIVRNAKWNIKDKIGTDMIVSHLGLYIKNSQGIANFREASSELGKVIDLPFNRFVTNMMKDNSIAGLAFFLAQ